MYSNHIDTLILLTASSTIGPRGPDSSGLESSVESMVPHKLQYDSGINIDISGHSSVNHRDLHNASYSDVYSPPPTMNICKPLAALANNDCDSYLMSFSTLPVTSHCIHPSDPLLFDPLRQDGPGNLQVVQRKSSTILPSHKREISDPGEQDAHVPSPRPRLEGNYSPGLARPRPRPHVAKPAVVKDGYLADDGVIQGNGGGNKTISGQR